MKSLQTFISGAALALLIASCSGKKNDQIVAPEGMCTIDLRAYGKPFAIFVPDTAHAKLEITEQPSGALEVRAGNSFAIAINEQASDIELKKKDIKEDEVNKFKAFVHEQPDAIFWESAIVEPEFHFLVNKKAGGNDYSFEDLRSGEGKAFSRQAVEKMYKSCSEINEVMPGKQHS